MRQCISPKQLCFAKLVSAALQLCGELSHLEPTVQTAGSGDTLAGLAGAAQRLLQGLDGPLGLLQLLDESVDGLLGPLLLLVALLPAQQPLHRRAGEREQGVQARHDVTNNTLSLVFSPPSSPFSLQRCPPFSSLSISRVAEAGAAEA